MINYRICTYKSNTTGTTFESGSVYNVTFRSTWDHSWFLMVFVLLSHKFSRYVVFCILLILFWSFSVFLQWRYQVYFRLMGLNVAYLSPPFWYIWTLKYFERNMANFSLTESNSSNLKILLEIKYLCLHII